MLGADADRYHHQHRVYRLLGWWYSQRQAVADMVKGCLPLVVVDTECGRGGGWDRQWFAVDDVVKGYLPLPLPSSTSLWSKGMMVVVNI